MHRLQVQNVRYGTTKYRGTFQTMYRIGKEEGITRLWRKAFAVPFHV